MQIFCIKHTSSVPKSSLSRVIRDDQYIRSELLLMQSSESFVKVHLEKYKHVPWLHDHPQKYMHFLGTHPH